MDRSNFRSRGLAFMLSSFVVLPVLFQGFFRYEYFTVGTSVWRIDRLTQQACRTSVTPVVCSEPAPMFESPETVPEMPGTHKWSGSTFNLALRLRALRSG